MKPTSHTVKFTSNGLNVVARVWPNLEDVAIEAATDVESGADELAGLDADVMADLEGDAWTVFLAECAESNAEFQAFQADQRADNKMMGW